MKHGIWKNKQMTKRLLSLTLACVMTLGLLPGMTTPVSADETADDSPFCSPDPNEQDAALNVLTAYRWKRVHKQSDLPQTKDKKVHVLILGYQDGKTGANDPVYYLMGDIARLHSAVISYARDFMIDRGFTYCVPPFMIRSNVVTGVMSFAEMDAMMYKIEGEDLYLIGTSEHSMIGKFKGQLVNEAELPNNISSRITR